MIFALVGLALAFAVALLFGGMEFDRGLAMLGYAGGVPWLVDVAQGITWLGDGRVLTPMVIAGALLLLYQREWRDALLLAAVTASCGLLVDLQKDWFARIRPDANEHLVVVNDLSFPSAHSANATAVWLSLALLLPRTDRGRFGAVWTAVWLALLVGASRVMLGVHWPSDVIGGWSFGLFWTLLLLRLAGHTVEDGTTEPAGYAPR